MLILGRARLALLAVPKTGSTAIEAALRPYAVFFVTSPPHLKHITFNGFRRRILPLLGKDGEGLETVALIREPLAWYGSWYRYRSRPALRGKANSTEGVSFDAFVTAHLAEDPPAFARVGTQAAMVSGREGRVTHLFRYEDQRPFWDLLAARGCHAAPPAERLNVSPPGDLALSAATEARLREARAEDFALWDSAGG